MNRDQTIKKYGIEIVEQDEQIWEEKGYKINYATGLLEKNCACAYHDAQGNCTEIPS